MKLTNKFNLPKPFEDFIRNDKYSRGDADISVTELIDSPRIRQMKRIHADNMEQDISDRIWSLFGTAVHHILESAEPDRGVVNEQRLSAEIDGWLLSGAVDYQRVYPENGKMFVDVVDYKVTSVWSLLLGEKPEWEKQLNTYAWLIEKNKNATVRSIKICAILRDWSRRKAEQDPSYPQAPVEMVDVKLWSFQRREDFVKENIQLHQNAEQGWDELEVLPKCTDEHRWMRPPTFAVKKPRNKRAVRVLDSMEDAQKYIDNQSDNTLYVEERKGVNTRCEGNFCGVSEFCSQFREIVHG